MDSAAARIGNRQFNFSGVKQNLESDISRSVAYLVKRGGPVNLRVKISELECLRTVERLFRGKREQYEGEKTLRGRVIGSFLRRKLEDRVTRLRKEEKFVELSQSPLTVDTKIVLAIRSFNYKWETIRLVFSLSASDKRGYTPNWLTDRTFPANSSLGTSQSDQLVK